MPNVFTIPAGESFADNLVRGLLARHGQTPLELAQVTLLLPSRRGARAVREAFLRQADGRPMLLPMMRAVGDVDEEELAFDGLHGGDMLDLPPAIPALRRQLLLAQLIGRQRGIDVVQAAPLARELAALLDRLQTEEVPFSALADLVPADFAAHWRITLDFLRLLEEPWQQLLAAEGGLDPAERRNRLLRAQSRRWRQRPPAGPVVVAGSTGSIPATAELIAVVAGLPGGAVVLPGLDRLADAETWAAVDPCHPQHGMKQLLETIGVDREQVAPWHGSGTAGRRDALLAEALRPTETTERWRHLPALGRDAVAGLARVDCASPQEEAGVIALALRQALETPGRTAALVTPDRGLARRVVAEMLRWGIAIDDSAGLPLAATPPGTLLRLTAVMLVEGLAPIALLAALKHPLARAGGEAGRTRRLVRELDRKALRGPRPAVGFAGLEGAVAAADGVSPAAVELVAELHRRGARVLELVTRPAAALADIVAGHVTFAEWLATDRDGECHLWRGEAGEAAMGFIAELLAAAEGLPPLAGAGYAALLAGLMEGLAVRPAFGLHPRLHIWGPLEARLQSADLLVLGGLNEGTWPPRAEADAWLSRPMARQLGLAPPEHRIGLAAHDFAQATAAPEVLLTRASKVEGTPTVPSRWLLRLEQVLAAAGLSLDARPTADLPAWQRGLDDAGEPRPIEPPACRPPVAARPRRLSVTQIETWMRDPYAIFARRILGLRALDPIAADAGAADYGIAVHQALEAFAADHPGALPDDAVDLLLRRGREAFGELLSRPGVRAFWWPRFRRIADWFVAQETARRPAILPVGTELHGEMALDGPAGPFVLTAIADRIDRLADGTLAIIDYKTGQPPNREELRRGEAPQLPLEAAIAMAGGFEDLAAAEVALLSYWRVGGGRVAGEVRDLAVDAGELAATALAGLAELIAAFDAAETPYRARPRPAAAPRFSDYDRLARVKEWSAGGPGDW